MKPEEREIRTTKYRIKKILDIQDENPNAVHDAGIMDRMQNEAIVLLAKQIDTLWTIVKAYKTGKL